MQTREKILAALRECRELDGVPLPAVEMKGDAPDSLVAAFSESVVGVSGQITQLATMEELEEAIRNHPGQPGRVVTTIPSLHGVGEVVTEAAADPRDYADVALSVLPGHFGVAENGAVWMTEELMGHRVLPFICQHLVLVLNPRELVATMHDAYGRLGGPDSGFGIFISGPSKTADIEQFLILGAHGPKTLTVFLVN